VRGGEWGREGQRGRGDLVVVQAGTNPVQYEIAAQVAHFQTNSRAPFFYTKRHMLNVNNKSLNEKYLGVPSDVGRSSNRAFKYSKDRV